MARRKLSASLEDYLEAIHHIESEKGAARAKDIAERVGVSRPSVTGALKTLAERELVNYAPYDVITLTAGGKAAAKDVVRRHTVLREFFTKVLAAGEQEANEAACKMEHAVPPAILQRFVEFAKYIDEDRGHVRDHIAQFAAYHERQSGGGR